MTDLQTTLAEIRERADTPVEVIGGGRSGVRIGVPIEWAGKAHDDRFALLTGWEQALALHDRRTDCVGTEENPVCHRCLEIVHILDDPTRRAVVVQNEAWPCRTVQALAAALVNPLGSETERDQACSTCGRPYLYDGKPLFSCREGHCGKRAT